MANSPIIGALAAAAMVATLTLEVSPADAGRDELLREVAKAAPQVHRFGDDISINSRWNEVSRGKTKIDACLAAVDAALAAGIGPREEFDLGGYGGRGVPKTRSERGQRGGRIHYSNLALIKSHCAGKRAKVQLLRTYFALREAKRTLDRIDRVSDAKSLAHAALAERVCGREVARALAMKNAPSITFERPDVRLGDAAKKICGKLGQALDTVRAKLRKQTDLSGFHKALQGDRRRIFDDHMMFAAEVYGPDKFPLAEPDDFAHVDIWYLVRPDIDDFGNSGWAVTIYRFSAAKLTDEREKRGPGSSPPAAAFRNQPAKSSPLE